MSQIIEYNGAQKSTNTKESLFKQAKKDCPVTFTLALNQAGTPLGIAENQIFTLESEKTVSNHDLDKTWIINVNTGSPDASPVPGTYEIYIFAQSEVNPSQKIKKKLKLKLLSESCENNSLNAVGNPVEISLRINRGLQTIPTIASQEFLNTVPGCETSYYVSDTANE